MKLHLPNVTLFGADTADLDRLLMAFEICLNYAEFGAMKIVADVEADYVTKSGIQVFSSTGIKSRKDYSEFIIKGLNNYIDTEFVLIAQHDGFILNPAAWDKAFLKYDYIGAPWLADGDLIVGNGGFSLRSKRLLEVTQSDEQIQIGSKEDDKYAENEDWVICMILREYIESKGITFAPVELAKQFSIEENEVVGGKWTNQFGFHGLRWTDISSWLAEHPEYPIHNPLDKV